MFAQVADPANTRQIVRIIAGLYPPKKQGELFTTARMVLIAEQTTDKTNPRLRP